MNSLEDPNNRGSVKLNRVTVETYGPVAKQLAHSLYSLYREHPDDFHLRMVLEILAENPPTIDET